MQYYVCNNGLKKVEMSLQEGLLTLKEEGRRDKAIVSSVCFPKVL